MKRFHWLALFLGLCACLSVVPTTAQSFFQAGFGGPMPVGGGFGGPMPVGGGFGGPMPVGGSFGGPLPGGGSFGGGFGSGVPGGFGGGISFPGGSINGGFPGTSAPTSSFPTQVFQGSASQGGGWGCTSCTAGATGNQTNCSGTTQRQAQQGTVPNVGGCLAPTQFGGLAGNSVNMAPINSCNSAFSFGFPTNPCYSNSGQTPQYVTPGSSNIGGYMPCGNSGGFPGGCMGGGGINFGFGVPGGGGGFPGGCMGGGGPGIGINIGF